MECRWPPRTTHGAEGQTWSHAGPAVALLFAPALSQARWRGPDAHTQSLFHSLQQHGSHHLTSVLWHYFAEIIAVKWATLRKKKEKKSNFDCLHNSTESVQTVPPYSPNNWQGHCSVFPIQHTRASINLKRLSYHAHTCTHPDHRLGAALEAAALHLLSNCS